MIRITRNASEWNRKATSTGRVKARRAAGMFEALEDRRLFATLTIAGTMHNDSIRLHQTGQVLTVKLNNTFLSYSARKFTDVVVECFGGNDRVVTTALFNKPLTLNGGAGNDSLQGGRQVDAINGGDGDDVMAGGASGDIFTGGPGGDCADYGSTTTGVTVSLDDVADDGRPGEGDNVRSDVENIVGGYGNDTLTGSAAANYIQGGGGTDTIYGLGGADTLDGGTGGALPAAKNNGNDVLWGGDGNDVLHASDLGNCTLYGESGSDALYGWQGHDSLYGGSGADALYGFNGNDILYGGTGDDSLDGGAGTDKVYGNAGPALFLLPILPIHVLGGAAEGAAGGFGLTIDPSLPIIPIDGPVVIPPILPRPIDPVLPPVDLTPRTPIVDQVLIDPVIRFPVEVILVETDNDVVHGGADNDRVRGDGGNDQVFGDAGNDFCYGDAGHNVIHGGLGNDNVYGGAGDDDLFGDEGGDVLVSIGGGQNDEATGGAGMDSIWCDSESTETIHADFWDAFFEGLAGNVHRVGGFQTLRTSDASNNTIATQTPSRELNGQSLLDPVGSGTPTSFSDRPLFAPDGASMNDIDQGSIGDCYWLAGLSATAKVGANHIQQAVVDLGDGTYAMRFYRGGVEEYWRIDGDLLTNGAGNPTYAGLGHGDSLWGPIMEKVFTFARDNKGTFSSIHGGFANEAFNALNMNNYGVSKGATAAATLQNIKAELDLGRAVVAGTPDTDPTNGCPCVKWHLYTVHSVDLAGNTITLRNPWATDGGGSTDGVNDGYVTCTASQFHGYFTGMWAGMN
jgi:Ca2+-binding RTX toxin-like protein